MSLLIDALTRAEKAKSKAEAKSEAAKLGLGLESGSSPEAELQQEPKVKPESESKLALEREVGPRLELKPELEPGPKLELAAELEPKPGFALKSPAEPEFALELGLEPELAPEPKVKPESEPNLALEREFEAKPEPTLEAESEPRLAAEPEPKPPLNPTIKALLASGGPRVAPTSDQQASPLKARTIFLAKKSTKPWRLGQSRSLLTALGIVGLMGLMGLVYLGYQQFQPEPPEFNQTEQARLEAQPPLAPPPLEPRLEPEPVGALPLPVHQADPQPGAVYPAEWASPGPVLPPQAVAVPDLQPRPDPPGRALVEPVKEISAGMIKAIPIAAPLTIPPAVSGPEGLARAPGEHAPPVPKAEESWAERIVVTRRISPPAAIDQSLLEADEARRVGDLARASQIYQQILRSDPQQRQALLGSAAIAYQRGEIDLALAHYQSLLKRDPGDPLALAGMLLVTPTTDLSRSLSELRLLLHRHPQNAALHFGLGNFLAKGGNWPEARQAYARALALALPGQDHAAAAYAFNLAVSLEHLGLHREAWGYYHQALSLAGDQAPVSFERDLVRARIAILERQL